MARGLPRFTMRTVPYFFTLAARPWSTFSTSWGSLRVPTEDGALRVIPGDRRLTAYTKLLSRPVGVRGD